MSCLGLLGGLIALGALAQPAATETRAPTRFDILEFAVRGNTVLANEDIERAVFPFMGEQRSIDDVDAARAALEKVYRDRGFGTVSVNIPEQRVDSGTVEIEVLEGRIARLRVTGSRYFSQGYILEKVPAAAEGSVPQFGNLQAELGIVNRTADRRVTPLLRPGRTPGTTEVDLVVEDAVPLHGSVEINNRASPNTSATRLQAGVRYDNLWQRDHSLSLQVQVSPEKTDEVRVFSSSYTLPMGEVGQNALTLSFIRSDSAVAAGVGSTTVFGKGNIYGLRYNKILDLGEGRYHLLVLGVDYKDLSETIETGDNTGFATPIAYLPLSAAYQGFLDDAQGRWQLGAGLVVGLSGVVNRETQFAQKRYRAGASFSVIKLDLGREHKLPLGLSLLGKVDVQFSGQPLISNEQFVAGGVDSVRGYLESSAVGDKGVRAALELRSPELAPKDWTWLSGVKAHAFLEGAALETIQPLRGQNWRFRLLGTGFGLRVKSKPYASFSLDLAWPLHTLGATQRGEPRLHATGSLEF
jgi:hemolysin activation/secretion protein